MNSVGWFNHSNYYFILPNYLVYMNNVIELFNSNLLYK